MRDRARHRNSEGGQPLVRLLLVVVLLTPRPGGQAAESYTASSPGNLAELSLEEIMNVKVTSVSKKPEPLLEAPTAIFVITGEDIRRSGANQIPEALRLAPGLEVARVDAHDWAISARGFNDTYANKLLVLMDGRSVYTPLFSGVFWDQQDALLEDLDRIEVIRGPGATLWGANAVNGVINFTTKSAQETQGTYLTGGGGSDMRALAGVRYGAKAAEDVYYRVFGNFANHGDSVLPDGGDANDRWQLGHGGFRMDWEAGQADLVTVQGDYIGSQGNQTYYFATPTPPYSEASSQEFRTVGGNLLARWTHSFANASELRFQTYYDYTSRRSSFFREDRDTVDAELQYRLPLGERQEVVTGAGYRWSDSYNTKSNFVMHWTPAERETHLANVFVQDEITLVKEHFKFTPGIKVEYNSYTDFEYQPSGRLVWTPDRRHAAWVSVSRAVRTPARAEWDVHLSSRLLPPAAPGLPPVLTTVDGNSGFRSEKLIAYELGYRVQPHDRLSLDLATFYNDYARLRTAEPGAPDFSTLPAYVHQPLFLGNDMKGETYGVEVAAMFQATDWWRWSGSYTFLQMQLHKTGGIPNPTQELAEGDSPHHQVSLRSSMDLPYHLQLDLIGRYVDELPARQIPAYVTLDVRLGWRPTKNLELAVVGQNLLDNQHPEFRTKDILLTPLTEVPRSVYGQLTFRF